MTLTAVKLDQQWQVVEQEVTVLECVFIQGQEGLYLHPKPSESHCWCPAKV